MVGILVLISVMTALFVGLGMQERAEDNLVTFGKIFAVPLREMKP
jgi:hypothetical protein